MQEGLKGEAKIEGGRAKCYSITTWEKFALPKKEQGKT